MRNIKEALESISEQFTDVTIDTITVRTVDSLQELDIKFKKAEPTVEYKVDPAVKENFNKFVDNYNESVIVYNKQVDEENDDTNQYECSNIR